MLEARGLGVDPAAAPRRARFPPTPGASSDRVLVPSRRPAPPAPVCDMLCPANCCFVELLPEDGPEEAMVSSNDAIDSGGHGGEATSGDAPARTATSGSPSPTPRSA